MLYELIGIVRPGNVAELKEIVTSLGQQILRDGGVIRSIDNWGIFSLPRAITCNKALYHNGHYFVMRYDSSARTQEALRLSLRNNVNVIRAGTVKLGDNKLDTLSRFGAISWSESS